MIITDVIVTDADLKKYGKLGTNVTIEKYFADLLELQQFTVLDILGEKLYKKIEQDFKSKQLEGIYKEIHILIAMILGRFIAYEFAKVSNFNMMNGGTFSVDNNGKSVVSRENVSFLANGEKNKGNKYVTLLRDFICNNKSQLEIYDVKNCKGCEDKNKSDYSVDWFLG